MPDTVAGPAAPRRRTVLHLAGSPTSDFFADLSRLYARGCLEALRDPGSRWSAHDHVVAWVAPDGSWRFPDDLGEAAVAAAEPLPASVATARLDALAPDVALPQMFCRAGMTDHRALLQVLGIPYVGNRPETMAVGADKALARAAVAAAGVRVPEAAEVGPGDPAADTSALPPLPVVVKPVDADNSDGVTLVRAAADLPDAVAAARRHGARVLVERYVELGREVRCGLVQHGGALVPLPLEEYAVDPATKPVRDRADKLRGSGEGLGLVAKDDDHAWILPADDPLAAPVHEAALRCWHALGCRHHALFDFRIDPQGRPWFLEAGLYCSFAPTSVVVAMARAAGIGLDDLLGDAVAAAAAPVHHPT